MIIMTPKMMKMITRMVREAWVSVQDVRIQKTFVKIDQIKSKSMHCFRNVEK